MRAPQDTRCTSSALLLQEDAPHQFRVEATTGLLAVHNPKTAAVLTLIGLRARTVLAVLDDVRAFAVFAIASFCCYVTKLQQLKFSLSIKIGE